MLDLWEAPGGIFEYEDIYKDREVWRVLNAENINQMHCVLRYEDDGANILGELADEQEAVC